MRLRAGGARLSSGPVARMLKRLGRHKLAAMIAAAVDLGLMILLVERFGLSPAPATLCGAISGGAVNFGLGRRWVFGASGAVLPQALRYAITSVVGATLNAIGVFVLHERGGVPYVVARFLVAGFVSLFWNYPIQRRFVFRGPRSRVDPASPDEHTIPRVEGRRVMMNEVFDAALRGAELNAEMEHQPARDTTVGPRRPLGRRTLRRPRRARWTGRARTILDLRPI